MFTNPVLSLCIDSTRHKKFLLDPMFYDLSIIIIIFFFYLCQLNPCKHSFLFCVSFVCFSRSAHRWPTSIWPRRPIRAQFLCSVPLAVVSMVTQELMACVLCATRSTFLDRTMEQSVLWVLWVRPTGFVTVLFVYVGQIFNLSFWL